MVENSLSRYIGTFQTKTNQSYGVRFVNEEDTKKISDIMHDVYGYEYLYPKVYDEQKLKENVCDKNQMWIMAESIDEFEPVGFGVAEKRNDFSIYVGKLAIKNRFRHQGLARELGANSFLAMLKNPEFNTVLRIDSDVRVNQYNSMLMAKALGQFPYAFVPNFNCYGDKRKFKPEFGIPYCDGRLEAALLYLGTINQFWKIRNKTINLLGNRLILNIYHMVQKITRRMKKDEVLIHEPFNSNLENYDVERDYYKGILHIKGYLKKKTLDEIVDNSYEWNLLEWLIPTTQEGIFSQKLAVDNGFVVAGYDPGSELIENRLQDRLVMCKFPKGVFQDQFRGMRLTEIAQPLASAVINQVKKLQNRKISMVQNVIQ